MYLESMSFICYLFPSRKTTWVQDAQMFPLTITSSGSLGEYMLLVPTTLEGVGLEVLVPSGEYMLEGMSGVSLHCNPVFKDFHERRDIVILGYSSLIVRKLVDAQRR